MNKDCAKGKKIPLSLTVTVDLRICLVDADAREGKGRRNLSKKKQILSRGGMRERERERVWNREFLPFLPLEGEERIHLISSAIQD